MADGGYHQEAKLQQDRARENIFISCFLFLLLLPVASFIHMSVAYRLSSLLPPPTIPVYIQLF